MVKDDTFKGVDTINNNDAANYILGYNDTTVLDASSGNAEAPASFQNCRFISSDGDGIVKIMYLSYDGTEVTEVKFILAGHLYPIRNVQRIFRYYVGTTPGTAVSYSSAGASITNAIKLHR